MTTNPEPITTSLHELRKMRACSCALEAIEELLYGEGINPRRRVSLRWIWDYADKTNERYRGWLEWFMFPVRRVNPSRDQRLVNKLWEDYTISTVDDFVSFIESHPNFCYRPGEK